MTYISPAEEERRLSEIRSFCDANGISYSKSMNSYYFVIRGQAYRVSNHTVEASNKRAVGRDGRRIREEYHPDGRRKDVIYIHASRFRIIKIYMDLKLGAILDGRGRVIGYTYRGHGNKCSRRRYEQSIRMGC